MSLRKGIYSGRKAQDHRLDHDGLRWFIRDACQGRARAHHRTDEREFRHDPRRTWQVGFDQHRRCWSLDRQAQQEVAESVPSNLPPFLPPSWRSSDDTISNADRCHRVPAVFGRRQTETN